MTMLHTRERPFSCSRMRAGSSSLGYQCPGENLKPHPSWLILALALGLAICACGASDKTLRVVSYNIDCADQGSDNNITGPTHSLPTVLQAIGLHHIGTNAQPVDVLGLEELRPTTLSNLTAQLNAIYGAGTYTFDGTPDPNTAGGPDGLIYNLQTVQVVSARALRTGQTVLLQSNGTYTAAFSPGGSTRAFFVLRWCINSGLSVTGRMRTSTSMSAMRVPATTRKETHATPRRRKCAAMQNTTFPPERT